MQSAKAVLETKQNSGFTKSREYFSIPKVDLFVSLKFPAGRSFNGTVTVIDANGTGKKGEVSFTFPAQPVRAPYFLIHPWCDTNWWKQVGLIDDSSARIADKNESVLPLEPLNP